MGKTSRRSGLAMVLAGLAGPEAIIAAIEQEILVGPGGKPLAGSE